MPKKSKHLDITEKRAVDLAQKIVDNNIEITELVTTLESDKDKLNKIAEPIRNKKLKDGEFFKSTLVKTQDQAHKVLMTYKNSYQSYELSEKTALKELFAEFYKEMFDEVKDQVTFEKAKLKELKDFFGEDKEMFNNFKEKFVKKVDSFVKPNNQFQEKVFELDLTAKQKKRAETLHNDAANSITFTIK